ncbi:MAG: hypothetical protein KUG57_11555 [Ilumatobacteraceae bacterium]|nr:hypothetical protein [Ilumatobacteraceae bacterium]
MPVVAADNSVEVFTIQKDPHHMLKHLPASVALGALICVSAVVAAPASPAAAASYTMTVVSPVEGRVGIDAIYQNGGGGSYDVKTCSLSNEPVLGWSASGQLVGTTSVPSSAYGLGSLSRVRFEMYPGECGTYDVWTTDVGGVHIEVDPNVHNLGEIRMPVAGQGGAFRVDGDILSSSEITAGRVVVDSFQIATGYPDPPAPLQQNGQVAYGAFSSGSNNGSRWSAGVGWSGRYMLFVTDKTMGRSITAAVDISAGAIPTIDLDAICFGFDTCTYGTGGPSTTPGSFHPVTPTRILDTRFGVGIANGPVRTGDGRHPSLDPITRRDETANHDLQVTGRFGIPSSGVSAVLLNVTADQAPGTGFLSVVPKPQRVGDVYNDQATYGWLPATSNLNVAGPAPVANLVLARVGAGGKIRFSNSFGPTHVIADVAGWFGTGGAHLDGEGFAGVVPTRVMDTRLDLGGPKSPIAAGTSRAIEIAGVAGIPENARSVVVNITASNSSGPGFVTAHPDGQSAPNASNLNVLPGQIKANTAVVKLGSNGKIRILAAEADMDIIVDVLGSFGPYGGPVTTITPARLIDTRDGLGTTAQPLQPLESRSMTLAGRGGIPASATAVIANITAVGPTAWGYLTAYPTGADRPVASNLNFLPGQTVPNLVMLKLGAGGSISIFNEFGSTQVIVDVMGYVS